MTRKNLTPTSIFREMREMLIEAPPEALEGLAKDNGTTAKAWGKVSKNAAASALARLEKERRQPTAAMHKGLTSFLVLLRRRDGLDQDELSAKANVDIDEIRKIESNPSYEPSPRTIYNLERAFSLPSGVLAKLTGAIRPGSPEIEERAMQFAANAKSIGRLSKEEMRLLAEFVRFLTEKR